jgi:hypothetical protein
MLKNLFGLFAVVAKEKKLDGADAVQRDSEALGQILSDAQSPPQTADGPVHVDENASEGAKRIAAHYAGGQPDLLALRDCREHGISGLALTYGATRPALVEDLLGLVDATSTDTFFDLGSGVGEVVLTAALICGHAHGVELLPRLHNVAVEAATTLEIDNVTFENGDIRDADVRDASIVFSYATCFPAELVKAVADKAAEAPAGARVIAVTHRLVHPELELVATESRFWGRSRPIRHDVFIYRRR